MIEESAAADDAEVVVATAREAAASEGVTCIAVTILVSIEEWKKEIYVAASLLFHYSLLYEVIFHVEAIKME